MTNFKLNLVVIIVLWLSGCYAPYSQDTDGEIIIIEEVEHGLNETEEITNTTEVINKTNTVVITNQLTFNPFELTINVNDTVTWINEDDRFNRAHIVFDLKRKLFRSERLTYGQQYSFTFTEPGIYEYSDVIFPEEMGRAKIMVR